MSEKIDLLKLASDIRLREAAKLLTQPATLAEHHYTEPQPIRCKWCGSEDIMKYGSRKGVQEYICQKCGRKFTAKDAPYKKQTPAEQIGAALNMFYDGMSFSDISRHLGEAYGNPVVESTVYRWVIDYTVKATNALENVKAQASDTWVVDETVVRVGKRNMWFIDLIDEGTRFLLASYLSRLRTAEDIAFVMKLAWEKSGTIPRVVISDGWWGYLDGIERVFGADAKHIRSKGFTEGINTNLIERFHGTLKDRTKVLRGFKTLDTAQLLLDGFLVHYNYFRPHMSLLDKTPAEVAGISVPYKNWTELVTYLGGLHRDA